MCHHSITGLINLFYWVTRIFNVSLFSLLQEARHQLHLDITDKHTTLEVDAECYRLNNNSANIGFQVNPTRTVKGSVTPETWDSFSNYNNLRAEAEMKASKHLREAIFATLKQTANDLEAQRQATEYSFRKRIHETNQARSELEWQQKNVNIDHYKIMHVINMSFEFKNLSNP